jgi:signal transduction histidine kinase
MLARAKRSLKEPGRSAVVTPEVSLLERYIAGRIPDELRRVGPEAVRRARVLVLTALVCAPWPFVFLGIYVVFGSPLDPMIGLAACGVAVGLVPEIQRVTRSPEIAGNVLVGTIIGVCALTSYYTGGSAAPALNWLIPAAVVALILVRPRHAFAWLGVVIAIVWGYYAFPGEALPKSFLKPAGLGALLAVSTSGLAVLLFSISWSFDRAKERMRGELAAANDGLALAKARAEEAHGKTKLILDNVGQGFLILDRSGRVGDVRSASVGSFLSVGDGMSFEELLRQGSEDTAALFALNWEQILDGALPIECSVEQLPKRVVLQDRHVSIGYRPLLNAGGDALDHMIVILTDITSDIQRERAETAEREALSVFRQVMSDRSRFAEFLGEGASLIASLVEATAPLEVERRNLHTLKGICGFHGLGSVVNRCHELETKQADTDEPLDAIDRTELAELWRCATQSFASLVGTHVARTIELSRTEHAAFIERIERGSPHSALRAEAQSWALEPLEKRLHAVGEQARALAKRLGRGDIRVVTDGGDLRQCGDAWRTFWSAFAHAVRNAVDHGLEPEDERLAQGKPALGTLELRTYVRRDRFVVEIADDGRGIDWDAVAVKAATRGLACESRADLEQRLYDDGFSTATVTTHVSGRGVGMGALRVATEERGGVIEIESQRSRGTTMRFAFPQRDVVQRHSMTGQDSSSAEERAATAS